MGKQEIVPLMTRLPADLHAELKTLAQQEERSLNWLIVALLRAGVTQRTQAAPRPPEPGLKRPGRSRTL